MSLTLFSEIRTLVRGVNVLYYEIVRNGFVARLHWWMWCVTTSVLTWFVSHQLRGHYSHARAVSHLSYEFFAISICVRSPSVKYNAKSNRFGRDTESILKVFSGGEIKCFFRKERYNDQGRRFLERTLYHKGETWAQAH